MFPASLPSVTNNQPPQVAENDRQPGRSVPPSRSLLRRFVPDVAFAQVIVACPHATSTTNCAGAGGTGRGAAQPSCLSHTVASGGSTSVVEWGWPCHASSPAWTPPMLPTPLPE